MPSSETWRNWISGCAWPWRALAASVPVLVEPVVRALQVGDAAERVHLRHAPGVRDVQPVAVEALDQRGRRGRSADQHRAHRGQIPLAGPLVEHAQHIEEHRGHAAGEGDALVREEPQQALRAEVAAGEDLLRARVGRGVGQAPGVRVVHRHHRQDRVALADADGVRHAAHHRQQRGGSVAVEHALGAARGARGVAHPRGLPLVQRRRLERLGLVRDQLLVVPVALGRRAVVGDHDHVLHGDAVADLLEGLEQRAVDEERAVGGVVDDVGQLVGVQARVERVHHRAAQRHGEVELQVAVLVPAERRDAVAGLDAERCEGVRELARAAREVGVAVAVDAAVGEAADELVVRELGRGALEEHGEREGMVVAHQAVQHRRAPLPSRA